MDEIQQTQKAGEGSTLVQAGTVTVNNNTFVGITEQQAREIFSEEMAKRAQCLAVEAQDTATKRMLDLFSDLMARVKKCEKDLSAFSDPGFIQNMRIAQEAAAVSDRKEDIETLSELLLARMNGALKRTTKTGIRKAMEIVPELEENELTLLATMFFYGNCRLENIFALSSDQYLSVLDHFFSALLSEFQLPSGPRWFQHLRILDCVELDPLTSFKKLEDYYAEIADGIVCIGIVNSSQEQIEATNILKECGLGDRFLVKNDLLPECVRLPIVNLNNFTTLPIYHNPFRITTNDTQKEGLRKVAELYKKDDTLLQKAKTVFAEKMVNYPAIQQLRDWLTKQKHSFELTPIGEVLAYVNARRCIPDLPIMELE